MCHWFGSVPWIPHVVRSVALIVGVVAASYAIIGPIIFVLSFVGSMPTTTASMSAAFLPTTIVAWLWDGTLTAFRVIVWGSIRSARWSSPRVSGHAVVSNRHIAEC